MPGRKLFPIERSASAPVFTLEPWRDIKVCLLNNCYSYAVNEPSSDRETLPQPGGVSGVPLHEVFRDGHVLLTVSQFVWGAEKDGLIRAFSPVARPGYYLVALVASDMKMDMPPEEIPPAWENLSGEFWDAHWYRQDSDGTWSHKHPFRLPSRADCCGAVIVDPRTCDRGIYKHFIGFFHVPAGGLCVGHFEHTPKVPLHLPQPKFR